VEVEEEWGVEVEEEWRKRGIYSLVGSNKLYKLLGWGFDSHLVQLNF
jgi:hypothetical protein